jgi:hypothetical protein
MRMLLPLKYAMILAPSMLSYSYIIDHVRLILCFRELQREEREDKQCYGAAGGASKLSQQQLAVGETTQEGGHIRASIYTQKATQPYRAGTDVRPRLNPILRIWIEKISQS